MHKHTFNNNNANMVPTKYTRKSQMWIIVA